MKAIIEKIYEETARIERTILIAGAIGYGGAFPDDLNEFFDDTDVKDIEKCLGKIPEYIDLEAKRYERTDAIFEWLHDARKLGFLVQFSTPVMTPTGTNSRSFSWGYYSTTWIYAETIEDAVEQGLKWVAKRRSDEDRKAKAKKGGEA